MYLFVQARMYRFQTPVRQTLICSNCRVLFYQLFLLCKHVNMNRTAAIFFRNVKTRVLDFCRRWPQLMVLDVCGYYQCLHLGPDFRTLVRIRTFLGKLVRIRSGFCSKVRIFHKMKGRTHKMLFLSVCWLDNLDRYKMLNSSEVSYVRVGAAVQFTCLYKTAAVQYGRQGKSEALSEIVFYNSNVSQLQTFEMEMAICTQIWI